jgi:hypothetical protein
LQQWLLPKKPQRKETSQGCAHHLPSLADSMSFCPSHISFHLFNVSSRQTHTPTHPHTQTHTQELELELCISVGFSLSPFNCSVHCVVLVCSCAVVIEAIHCGQSQQAARVRLLCPWCKISCICY